MLDDPYDLNRFLFAQARDYGIALAELRTGAKRSHWMWYVFPQLDGLGYSAVAKQFSIKSLDEARAYLAHPVLGKRITDCSRAVLQVQDRTARQIFGTPDDLKLRSSMTLFAQVSDADAVFHRVLERYFDGAPDARTLDLLSAAGHLQDPEHA
ncbi:MAG: DUF1810 domain-containing protein [Xanthomonadales bacterium]|jgi:uncharacterized protein (DUF1810 family)|nr:DUF1810 domain-containing protein [Xanthomonadales bacterium]